MAAKYPSEPSPELDVVGDEPVNQPMQIATTSTTETAYFAEDQGKKEWVVEVKDYASSLHVKFQKADIAQYNQWISIEVGDPEQRQAILSGVDNLLIKLKSMVNEKEHGGFLVLIKEDKKLIKKLTNELDELQTNFRGKTLTPAVITEFKREGTAKTKEIMDTITNIIQAWETRNPGKS